MNKESERFLGGAMLYFCLFIWILFWCHDALPVFVQIPYNLKFLNRSLDQLHAMHCLYDENSRDYYLILEYCNKIVPKGEKIQLILPKEKTNRYEFLREKGRYYLYPRNYGNNEETEKYILVYGVQNFKIPEGYQKKITFGADKYLVVRIMT